MAGGTRLDWRLDQDTKRLLGKYGNFSLDPVGGKFKIGKFRATVPAGDLPFEPQMLEDDARRALQYHGVLAA